MDYQNRSERYDWFKSNSDKKRTPKEKAKLSWKITKAFTYVSLFVISMVGCVQNLSVIKSQNSVGNGLEIYTSEKKILPHSSHFSFKKLTPADIKKLNESTNTNVGIINSDTVGTTGTADIYHVAYLPESNLSINTKNPQDQVILDELRDVVKNQGANNDLSFKDAWKGLNETFRVTTLDSQPIAGLPAVNDNFYYFNQNNPDQTKAILSSKADKYNIGGVGANPLDDLSSLYFWQYNDKGQASQKFEKRYIRITDKPKDGNIITDVNKLNSADRFKIAFLKEFFSPNNDFYNNFLAKNPMDISDDENIQKHFNQNQLLSASNLLKYAQIANLSELKEFQYEGQNVKAVQMSLNSMPLLGNGESDFRPIVTWGDSWRLGPFYGLFVFPIGKLFVYILEAFPIISGWEALLSIILIVVICRLVGFLLSFKSSLQQTKMQDMQSKKAVIDAKYAAYKGNKQMEQRKRQEIAALNKKLGINPLAAFASIFVTMPIFLTLWKVIGGVAEIKTTVWLGINFSATSWREFLQGGQVQYLPLLILAAGIQILSQLMPKILNRKKASYRTNVYEKEAQKKNNRTQNILMLLMVFMSLIFNAGLQIYWIVGGLWRILEVYITHRVVNRKKDKKGLFSRKQKEYVFD